MKRKFLKLLATLAVLTMSAGFVACGGVFNIPGVGGTNDLMSSNTNPSHNGNVEENSNQDNEQSGGEAVHQHLWSGGSITKKASCTEKGEKVYSCLLCEERVVEELDALEHNVVKCGGREATCTEIGWEEYEYCDREGCEYTTYEEIKVTPHDLVSVSKQVATCTDIGWDAYEYCKNCDYTTYEEIEALGHDRIRYAAHMATCTESGYETYEVCLRDGCQYTTYKEIPSLGHDLSVYEKQEASCTKDGWETYEICNRCDYETEYVKIPAIGHTYKDMVCTKCGTTEPDHQHVWDDGVTTREATCTQKGEKTYSCGGCEETRVEILPLISHDNTSFAMQEATCEENGWFAYTVCKNCGYSTYIEIEALGHSYDNGIITKPATCEGVGEKTYTCLCGKTYIEEVKAKGHAYGAWTVTKPATCDETGEETRVCSTDASHKEVRVISVVGHNYGSWVLVQEPTCGAEGKEERVCRNDSSHIETRSVAKTNDHNVSDNGTCLVCKEVIKKALDKVDSSNIQMLGDSQIVWASVENAVGYSIRIDAGEAYITLETADTKVDLKEYFKGNKQLAVYIRALAGQDSENANSAETMYIYNVQGDTVLGYKSIGKSVNFLTGGYTETGTVAATANSIFDEVLFSRQKIEATENLDSYAGHVYGDNLESYLEQMNYSYEQKINSTISVEIPKLFNASMNIDFQMGGNYDKKTFGETVSAFYDMTNYHVQTTYKLADYDKEILMDMLSKTFLSDVEALENGGMNVEAFIAKYGTHVITSSIYGAMFSAHYELVTHKNEINASADITEKMQTTVKGDIQTKFVNGGAATTNGTTLNEKYYKEKNEASQHSKFTARSKGGPNIGVPSENSLSGWASVYNDWVNGFNNDDDKVVLIDVENGSLVCIWDLLGDEYAEAKRMLNDYFTLVNKEAYSNMQNKINSLYSEKAHFDKDAKALVLDFTGLTAAAEFEGVKYSLANGVAPYGVTFNGKGDFRVYSAVNGIPVEKVIFRGNYGRLNANGNEIKTTFNNLSIKFDKGWTQDIVIEFDGFAYKAPTGFVALDFEQTSSKNVTINVIGKTYIRGGNGVAAGNSGSMGISANSKNVLLSGSGNLVVEGGNGVAGEAGTAGSKAGSAGNAGKNGGNGGVAVGVKRITVVGSLVLQFKGGNGGAGGKGGDGHDGAHGTAHKTDASVRRGGNGGNGGAGGTGGAGAYGLYVAGTESISLTKTCTIVAGTAGAGGRGGNGGDGGNGGNGYWAQNNGRGGSGGNAGKGGNAYYGRNASNVNLGAAVVKKGTDGTVGNAGSIGYAGSNGSGGWNTDGGTKTNGSDPGKGTLLKL